MRNSIIERQDITKIHVHIHINMYKCKDFYRDTYIATYIVMKNFIN